MTSTPDEDRLLSHVLEGLDALCDRSDHSEIWLSWLVDAATVALRGSVWEAQLSEAARALAQIARAPGEADERYRMAFAATSELRLAIAQADSAPER